MDRIEADTAQIEAFTRWLAGAKERMAQFLAYYQGQWINDYESDDAPSLPVASQDLPYDAIVAQHEALTALLTQTESALADDE